MSKRTVNFTVSVPLDLSMTVDDEHPMGRLATTLSEEALTQALSELASEIVPLAVEAGLPSLNKGESWAHLEVTR